MRYSCSSTNECFDILHSMARNVMRLMEQAHIDWQVTGGTLLGLVREQSLSPHDEDMDVDLAVEEQSFAAISKSKSPFIQQLNMLGYHAFRDYPHILRICIAPNFPGLREAPENSTGNYYDKHKYIDVYEIEASSTSKVDMRISTTCVSSADMFPTFKLLFHGVHVRMPAHPYRVLTTMYGNWGVVDKSKHGDVSRPRGECP